MSVETGGVDDFLDMMPRTVTIEPFLGRDQYTKPTYGAGVDYKARLQDRFQMVRNAEGEQVVARGIAYIACTAAVSVKDRITLPDGSQPIILSADNEDDETGAHHLRLAFA